MSLLRKGQAGGLGGDGEGDGGLLFFVHTPVVVDITIDPRTPEMPG